jgi:hypothetical protein
MIDFLGIGAQKAATTWLFERLGELPQIHFPAGKEVHFWDNYPQNDRDVSWWLDLFPDDRAGRKQGEITPAYALLDPPTIGKLKEGLPNLLVFYSVRNPIARAWSQAMMALSIGRLAGMPYSQALVEEFLKSAGVTRRGDYVTAITNWRKVFPRLHIIVFDDIVAQPTAVLAELCRYLGVNTPATSEERLAARVFAGAQRDVPDRLLDLLRMQYRPVIERMPELIGRDVSHWLEWDGRPVSVGQFAATTATPEATQPGLPQ